MKSKILKSLFGNLFSFAVAAAIFVPGAATAGDLQQVDGKLWKSQPKIVKQAYIVGISNLVDAEYAYQVKVARSKPRSDQTLIQRLYEGGNDQTVDSVVKAVDDWYAANPDKLGKAVLDVLWLNYVKKKS